MLFKMTSRHARIAVYSGVIAEALLLKLSRADNALANRTGSFLCAFAGNITIFDRGHFNVQIDAVEQRAGDSLAIALHLKRPATAFALQVAKIAAWTWIHRRNEHQLRRESDATCCAGHGDLPVFKRLAQYFQRRSLKLGQLIEKKDAVMGKAYFTRIRKRAAAEQPNVADGMMRVAEWSDRNERFFGVEQAGNAMNLRRLNCFFEGERRNNGRNALGQHRVARTGRTNHQDIVTASDSHFDGALNVPLPLHVAEINIVTLMRGEEFAQIGACGEKRNFAAQESECLPQILHAVDIDLIYHRG